MATRVDITTAARLTGRSEKTIRRWLREDPCPLTVYLDAPGLARRGRPAGARYLDIDELRRLHERRGGVEWHADYAPPDPGDAGDPRAELTTLGERVVRLEARVDALAAELRASMIDR